MDSNSFVFWLNGFLELSDAKSLDERQTQIVKDHLKLVFDKVTPNRSYCAPPDLCVQYINDAKKCSYEEYLPNWEKIDPATVFKTC